MKAVVVIPLIFLLPLPLLALPSGIGVMPLSLIVLHVVSPRDLGALSELGLTFVGLQAAAYVAMLILLSRYLAHRVTEQSNRTRLQIYAGSALTLVIVGFLPICTLPGGDRPWLSAIAMQGWLLLSLGAS